MVENIVTKTIEAKEMSVDDLNGGYPGDYCCALYKDSYYAGDTKTLCHDPTQESTVFNLGEMGFNDEVSSWTCGKLISYQFCKDDSPDCTGKKRESGAGTIADHQIGNNDWVTDVVLYNYDSTTQGAITMFEEKDCSGLSAGYIVGEYNESEMKDQGMGNNDVNSLMVPFGYSVELFQKDNFKGHTKTVVGGAFTDFNQHMACISIKDDFHNEVTSLKVTAVQQGPAPFSW